MLAPDGRLVVATFDREHFERYWLNRFFPSLLELDRARFPTAEQLSEELAGAPASSRVRSSGSSSARA